MCHLLCDFDEARNAVLGFRNVSLRLSLPCGCDGKPRRGGIECVGAVLQGWISMKICTGSALRRA